MFTTGKDNKIHYYKKNKFMTNQLFPYYIGAHLINYIQYL